MFTSQRETKEDMLEWRCHLALQDATEQGLTRNGQALQTALADLGGELEAKGRLFTRIQIACLFVVFSERPIVRGDDNNVDLTPLSQLSPEEWNELIEQLELIRSHLIQKETNVFHQELTEMVMEETDVSDLLHADYDSVVALLKVHEIVSRFRKTLKELDVDSTSLLKQVEAAVDTYKSSLKEIHTEGEHGLTAFLLKDLYKTNTKDLPELLCRHVTSVMENDAYRFSYASLRGKFQHLLQNWHDKLLSVPTLVRLGYGTRLRMNSIDETASVSSWGADDKEKQESAGLLSVSSADDDTAQYATAEEEESSSPQYNTQPPPPDDEPLAMNDKVQEKSDSDGKKRPRAKDNKSDDAKKRPRAKSTGSIVKRRRSSKSKSKQRALSLTPRAHGNSKKRAAAYDDDDDQDSWDSKEKSKGSRVAAARGRSIKKKKRTAKRVQNDDDESISEPEEVSPAADAAARTNRNSAKREAAAVIGWTSESEGEVESPKKQKGSARKRFTEEEKEAIREGVRLYGVGNWKVIKDNAGGKLARRTNVNIKDCYRTMKKRGDI